MTFIRKSRRPKKKGIKPSKREQAQMLALRQLGGGTYEIGEIMNRNPRTIAKYCNAPMFKDPRFQRMVEEYKSKEILDLTCLSIESRARIHDLIPTMTPIEAVATMDKSFSQRRLLEGRSTENIFSLRAIIEGAHKETVVNAVPHSGAQHAAPPEEEEQSEKEGQSESQAP